MTPIFIKALPDMIAIDVIWSLCIMDRQIVCIHSQQVWVAGYKPQWNIQMTPIFMKALPDMIAIDVMRTLCSIDLRLIASTVSRYDFQDINRTGIIKWRLYLWIHQQIRFALTSCGPYVILTVRLVTTTVSRYEFQDINRTGIIKWRLYLWIHQQIRFPSDWLQPQSAGMSFRI